MRRMDFLKAIGASSIGLITPGCMASYERFFDLEEDFRTDIPVNEKYVNSICQLCPAGCGIRVRIVNGKVIQIKGNPLSPINRGRICPRGAAGTEHLYSPERIKHPLLLEGEKGFGSFREIGWDEALSIVVKRLRQLRENGEPQKLTFLSGYQRGLSDRLFRTFLSAYGTPNYLKIDRDAGMRKVLLLMHGAEGHIGFDLENADYILNFGIDLFESSASPVWHNWVHGYLRRGRPGKRAKLVHLDPIRSLTAVKSDEWINLNPGTSGALALGIANVLIKRNLYSSDFIKSNTFGFDDWSDAQDMRHKGFETLVLEKYDPKTVSEITNVPIHDIDRLAQEFAANQPSIAIFDDSIAQYPGGVYSQMAVHSLNAMVGNFNSPGGIIFPEDIPYANWPLIKKDSIAIQGLSHQRVDRAQTAEFPLADSVVPNILGEQIENEIDTLFIHNCNPLYTLSEHGRYARRFENIPFIVAFSSFFDDTSPFCDLILPVPTFLEKWDTVFSGYQTGFNQVLSLMKPAISPVYDTRSVGDIFLHLAKSLGPPISDSLPWDTFEDLLRYSLEGIFSSQTGMVFSGTYDKSWIESLERSGWRLDTYATFEEFWTRIVEAGGWWNPVLPGKVKPHVFQSPSGKFEFYSNTLYRHFSTHYKDVSKPEGLAEVVRKVIRSQAISDELFMPHYDPPGVSGNSYRYPLVLHPFETGALRDGAINSQPTLMKVLNPFGGEKWDSWAEVNPETAQKYNLHDNTDVIIESSVGRIKTTLKISERIVPEVIGIPFGLGHRVFSDNKREVGVNPNSIIVMNVDQLSGIDCKKVTRVRVYPV